MLDATIRILVLAVALLLMGHPNVLPAAAEGSSVGHGEGVPDFVAIVRQNNASREPFRIEGVCKSAFTLFLGIRNVCVERSATLMFHAGHDIAENITGPDTRASCAALYRYNEVSAVICSTGTIWTLGNYAPLEHLPAGGVEKGQAGAANR